MASCLSREESTHLHCSARRCQAIRQADVTKNCSKVDQAVGMLVEKQCRKMQRRKRRNCIA